MKRILSILIFVLMFCSCNQVKKQNNSADVSKVERMQYDVLSVFSKKITIGDEIRIPLDAETTFYTETVQFYSKKDQQLLITMPLSSNTINVYDISKKNNCNQVNKIKIPLEGPNSVDGEIGGFLYHNRDSIFVLSKFGFKVGLINNEGEVLHKYQIQQEYSPNYTVPIVSTFSPISFIDNAFYFSGTVPEKKINGKFSGLLMKYDIEEKKTSYLLNNFPDGINAGYWERMVRLFYDVYSLGNNNQLLLSYMISDSLYLFNPKSQQLNSMMFKSSYVSTGEIKPFSKSYKKPKDYVERAKYTMAQPKYLGVKVDVLNNRIYRFVINKNSYANFTKGIFPDIYLIVSDLNFNILAEEKIDREKYKIDMCFVSNEGLYIANKQKYDQDDNFLVFDLFSIE